MSAQNVIDLAERLPRREATQARQVVAVVLSDGTVRELSGGEIQAASDDFAKGQVSGEGWTLWWERRDW